MNRKVLYILVLASAMVVGSSQALANHAWGNYHWERSANPLSLQIGDNVSADWDSYLGIAIADWNQSSVLNLGEVVPGLTNPKNCKAIDGTVQVCSENYRNTGWLGVAQIWVSGDHITSGTAKVNDFYYKYSSYAETYDTPEWRLFVICQEVGHAFGLGHQDENFNNSNLGSCMDYTSNPSTNQHPNAHDYAMLDDIYAHLDSSGGGSGDGGGGDCNPRSPKCNANLPPPAMGDLDLDDLRNWGRLVASSADGRYAVFELDFGGGHKVITFVIWA